MRSREQNPEQWKRMKKRTGSINISNIFTGQSIAKISKRRRLRYPFHKLSPEQQQAVLHSRARGSGLSEQDIVLGIDSSPLSASTSFDASLLPHSMFDIPPSALSNPSASVTAAARQSYLQDRERALERQLQETRRAMEQNAHMTQQQQGQQEQMDVGMEDETDADQRQAHPPLPVAAAHTPAAAAAALPIPPRAIPAPMPAAAAAAAAAALPAPPAVMDVDDDASAPLDSSSDNSSDDDFASEEAETILLDHLAATPLFPVMRPPKPGDDEEHPPHHIEMDEDMEDYDTLDAYREHNRHVRRHNRALRDITAVFYNEERNQIFTGNKAGQLHVWGH